MLITFVFVYTKYNYHTRSLLPCQSYTDVFFSKCTATHFCQDFECPVLKRVLCANIPIDKIFHVTRTNYVGYDERGNSGPLRGHGNFKQCGNNVFSCALHTLGTFWTPYSRISTEEDLLDGLTETVEGSFALQPYWWFYFSQ